MNKNCIYVRGVILLVLTLLAAPTVRADVVVTVDPSIEYGTWQGWGTSLAWWAKVIGGYPEPARSDYITKAFDPVQGLGLNVVRYNIGGGENPAYQAPHKESLSFRAAVPGYEPSPGVWDWSADANQRWVLKAAMQHGANQVEAFSNSPPWWATVSGSVTGGQGGAANLRPDAEAAFTEYLTEVVRHFHDTWGITFRDIEPLNEPSAHWWTFGDTGNKQEGCRVDPAQQNSVVNAVVASLAKRNITYTSTTASDENSVGGADNTFSRYDASALAGLSKINTHTYGGGDRTQLFDFAASAGKDLWMSEYGDGDASGLRMAQAILTDVKGLHPSAWVYWQFVDGLGGWAMMTRMRTSAESKQTTTAYSFNQKYYVMGQFSRFIRPGDVLIANDDPNSLTAYDPRTKSLVLVATNSSDAPRPVTYRLSRFTRLGATAIATRTSASEKWATLAPVTLAGKNLSVTLPPKSVTSYVIPGALYAGQQGFGYRDFYRLINVGSGLPLSVVAKGPVSVSAGQGGPDQQWGLIGLGNGLYQVINRASGLALDVGTALTTPGASVIQYGYSGGKNQIWHPVPTTNGGFTLLNLNSGLALSAGPDGIVTQQTDDGSPPRRWRIVRVP